ncbi:APH(3') family aminoglycoside O-phosphotransferase [Asanoa iriomotensis]|uniref:Aminoglycoside phosphotransferase APH(3') n=1 Tax=Asanoa iriomotensis TaxID=234613 RepID=A0ABQ4BUT1_9ACTN|nr:APH(3') family aminoglycoside O-phosphotransferase [Asanoa iriomotensis]GIF54292.1 aminoglycoside phosphotransferase APH(3') [Asanoa iriomotensis]
MTEWLPVRTGKSGAQVWRSTDAYRKHGDPTEIAAEAARLTWLAAQGFPCPEVLDHEPGRLTTRALPGHPAPAGSPAVAAAIGELLRTLHDLPPATCPFDHRLAITVAHAEANARAERIELTDLDAGRTGWSAAQLLAELHATRPQAPEDLVVGHGDPCLPNILFDDQLRPTGVVDVSRLGIADRHNDLAIATRSKTTDAEPLLRAYGLPHPDPAKIAFYRLLDEFF